MATIKNFHELESWVLARSIARQVFDFFHTNDRFIKDFALRDQMRRSSGSIMDNIAEGFGRGNNKEFICFLGYSNGSCAELVSQCIRAEDSGYISADACARIKAEIQSVSAMNARLIEYLRSTQYKGTRYR